MVIAAKAKDGYLVRPDDFIGSPEWIGKRFELKIAQLRAGPHLLTGSLHSRELVLDDPKSAHHSANGRAPVSSRSAAWRLLAVDIGAGLRNQTTDIGECALSIARRRSFIQSSKVLGLRLCHASRHLADELCN